MKKEKNSLVAWGFAICAAIAGHAALCSMLQSRPYEKPKGQKQTAHIMTLPGSSSPSQPWQANLLAWLRQANPELFVKPGPNGFSGHALTSTARYAVRDFPLDDDEAPASAVCADPKAIPLPQKSWAALADALLDRKSATPWPPPAIEHNEKEDAALPLVFRNEAGEKLDITLDDLPEISKSKEKLKSPSSTWLSVEYAKPPLLNRVRIVTSCGEPGLDHVVQLKLMRVRKAGNQPWPAPSGDAILVEAEWRGFPQPKQP